MLVIFTKQDPLGVAVQQTFGIGLGYNFDHTRMLEKDEQPTIRRLQARAAKSAIKRVQKVYDAEAARDELDGISDSKERGKKALELRKRTDDEIKYLAKRLTELVPMGLSEDFQETTRVQQFRQKNYVKTSSHEYVMQDPLESAYATEDLFQDTGASTVDAEAVNTTEAEATPSPDQEDEFIEAYVEQMKSFGDDDDDDDIKIMLA
jgi:hypothetical protein